MRYLPSLSADDQPRHLPLSDTTAAVLADALLVDDDQRRGALVAEALAADPVLALWTLSTAAACGGATMRDVATAAVWLAQQGPRVFIDLVDHDPAGDSSPAVDWAGLIADGVATAVVASRMAGESSDGDPQEAYLLGLVHAADRWFDSATAGAAGAVQTAVKLLADRKHAPAAVREHLRAAAERGDVARRRWLAEPTGWADLLPRLCARLVRLRQLEGEFDRALQSAKLDSLKELAYGAGHEINNPLANISTRAQTLLRGESDPERRRMLATINRQAFRAHEMIADMMLFARPQPPQFAAVDVAALARRVVGELAADAAKQGTSLSCTASESRFVVSADGTQLAVALRALCVNALEALGMGGRVEIGVEIGIDRGSEPNAEANAEAISASAGESESVRLMVADNGPGMDDRSLAHLFDPFFSGREAGRGLGFGLSKCWTIVTAHGGRIDVDSGPHRGTTFCITLPIEPARQL